MNLFRKIWLALGQSTRGVIRSAIRAEVQRVVAHVVTQDVVPALQAEIPAAVQTHVERAIDQKVVPVVTAKIEQRLPKLGTPISNVIIKEVKEQLRK